MIPDDEFENTGHMSIEEFDKEIQESGTHFSKEVRRIKLDFEEKVLELTKRAPNIPEHLAIASLQNLNLTMQKVIDE
jgi:hypothetical protein